MHDLKRGTPFPNDAPPRPLSRREETRVLSTQKGEGGRGKSRPNVRSKSRGQRDIKTNRSVKKVGLRNYHLSLGGGRRGKVATGRAGVKKGGV